MDEQGINLEILEDENLFLGIRQLKNQFISLFSSVANRITEMELLAFHPQQQGKKISKGNELQHCPYQVLDLVRNFDRQEGFNIRILNWWGHGLYVLVFFGSHRLPKKEVFKQYLSHGYRAAQTGSPWDYKGIIKHKRSTRYLHDDLESHLQQYHHLQLLKKIPYNTNNEELEKSILAEWKSLKKFHHIK